MTTTTVRSTRTWPTPAVGAWLWLGCSQFFFAEQITRFGWRGPYSMIRNYISDLGMLSCHAGACSPLHWLMNGSFVLQGLLICFGALGLRQRLPRALWILFTIAGLGVLLVGLVPEGTASSLHLTGAAAHFVAGNLGMILLGWMSVRRSPSLHGWLALLAGVAGMAGTVAIAESLRSSWPVLTQHAGLVERLAAYPLPLWLTFTGMRFVRGASVVA